jgi:hypothetical protein
LREKGVEHVRCRQRAVGARIIGGVAPVLEGAEEEHLDAELPGLFDDGEDIGFLDMARVDRPAPPESAESAAMRSRSRAAFSNSRSSAARVHVARIARARLATLAGQEIARLADEFGIIVVRDFAGAGPRAALDLELQTGPRAALAK